MSHATAARIKELKEALREERYQCFHRCQWKMNKRRNWSKHLPMPGEFPTRHHSDCKMEQVAGDLHSALLDVAADDSAVYEHCEIRPDETAGFNVHLIGDDGELVKHVRAVSFENES